MTKYIQSLIDNGWRVVGGGEGHNLGLFCGKEWMF
jgi:hypothetical protein